MTTAPPVATAEAVAADVASRDAQGERPGALAPAAARQPGEGRDYTLGEGILRPALVPHEHRPGEPLYRPLRIYTVDPTLARLDGAVATVNVAYEPLRPGPVGAVFEVEDDGLHARRTDLDDYRVLMAHGYEPSPSDPRFHHQMVYAVCSNVYSAFRTALGRIPGWNFGRPGKPARLVLRPHDALERNAWYDKQGGRGVLHFGYFPASDRPGDSSLPHGCVFTCLSHDIVVHEVTHALLDGMRARLLVPSNPDILAFHEALADLVAIFQRFSYPQVVLAAIRRSRGMLQHSDLLGQLASQFGHAAGGDGPLRTAIEQGTLREYDPGLEPHALGSVLVSAIFEAFATVFGRKTERIVRLATGGSGVLPPGEMPHDLQALLADKASRLASQFLSLCIRAIDYCPPAGLRLGEYLRALVTGDHDLVPDDPWDYRGALIDAFWRRRIYPPSVQHMSQDALLWKPPRQDLPPLPGLAFGALRFQGDPAQAADTRELRRQAGELGRYVSEPSRLVEFGLVAADDPRLAPGDRVERPQVESVRCARRAGPNGQIVFDLVAEVTQAMHVAATPDAPGFTHHGGCTVILSPVGEVRYAIVKSLLGEGRLQRRCDFLASGQAKPYWVLRGDRLEPREGLLRLLHAGPASPWRAGDPAARGRPPGSSAAA